MSRLELDPMDDATLWSAFESDGVTPSTELTINSDSQRFRFGPDRTSARIEATTNASGHVLRSSLTAVDLTDFDEIRLAAFSSRSATGGAAPFRFELRLGSAALPIDAAANAWNRLLPVSHPNRWGQIRCAIDDLDPAVRVAMNAMQLRCVHASTPLQMFIDDVDAIHPELVADVDAALGARLQGLSVSGVSIPPVIRAPANAPTLPSIDIVNYDVRRARERSFPVTIRSDFDDKGYRLRSGSEAYDIHYAIRPFVSNRTQQAGAVEFVLQRIRAEGELVVNGVALTTEFIDVPALDRIGAAQDEAPTLYLEVKARQEALPPSTITPVGEYTLETTQQEAS